MSIRDRAAAWWSAWQWVVYLAIALALSLYGNYRQFRAAIEAPLKAVIAGQDEALDDSAALLASSRERAEVLYIAASATADRLDRARKGYDQAAREKPLAPECAPGAGRMDAVNTALGSKEPSPRRTK